MTKYDRVLMQTAWVWSDESFCVRSKVGCVIARDSRVVSIGYNGTPSGFMNICEDIDGNTKDIVIHAEQNALMFAAKSGIATNGTTIYCTLAPCAQCALLIIQAGIKRVVFAEYYRDRTGLETLKRAKIETVYLPSINPNDI